MAWETRNRGGRYYTQSARENGRVVRRYIGCGPFADLVAAQDAAGRAERDAERRLFREERQAMREVEAAVGAFSGMVDNALREILIKAGYHHQRGNWRKMRRGTDK